GGTVCDKASCLAPPNAPVFTFLKIPPSCQSLLPMKFKNFKNKIYNEESVLNITDIRYLPRWVVLVLDLSFVAAAIFFSCYLIEKLTYSVESVFYGRDYMYILILGISLFYMIVFRTFTGIIRH